MCGIVGLASSPGSINRGSIEAMVSAIEHRGPDDRGFFFDDAQGIGLGNNRLSIIDLTSAGHLPMVSEDGQSALAYNGEVYNFRELRTELEQLGHTFRSRSDSEVVLRAFQQWGIKCLDRFCGMFAFAAWSSREKKLYLARDPMGMKPLYYTALPGANCVAFASEVKALLTLPGFSAQPDRLAVGQFLEFGYTIDRARTALSGVFKVPPGHFVEIEQGRPRAAAPFFAPPAPAAGDDRTLEDRQDELYRVLCEVVPQHLISDVPLGLLLSGGIDSSVIAAIAARSGPIETISMGFSDSDIDERPYARQVSDFIHSNHTEVTISPSEVVDSIEDVVWYFDDLFADWGTFSTRLLYKKCRERGIKVVLVGEGSDEIFGGYPAFESAERLRGPLMFRLFQLYRRYAGKRYGSHFREFARIMKLHLKRTGPELFGAVRLFESINQLPNNYVMKVDKASMSVSVEARAPFLDRRIAEIALATPARFLLANGTNKYLLRSVAERFGLLPAAIAWRPKFGASIAASWMDESDCFRRFASNVILDKRGWVDELGLRPAMTDYFAGRRLGYAFPRAIGIFSNLAWRLLLLNLWSVRYLSA